MDADSRKKIYELLFWLADRPLKLSDLRGVLGEECPEDPVLKDEISALGTELDERGSPMQLLEVANGFQMASRPAFGPWVRRLFKEKTTMRLSPSALETLAIVAYKQPITRSEIEDIRGVDSSGVVDNLLERRLLRIAGRKEALGRPLLYGTTVEFMRQFGLKAMSDLPKPDDLLPPEDRPQAADGAGGETLLQDAIDPDAGAETVPAAASADFLQNEPAPEPDEKTAPREIA